MIRIPIMRGVIERRILASYRIEPTCAAQLLPAPFRPHLINGYAVAGICLIRLGAVRPRWAPKFLGVRSENAAHRIAVEWDSNGQLKHGVYIPRRDTSSRLNALVGGRLFPGVHHHAHFDVTESADRLAVSLKSDDAQVEVRITGRLANPTEPWPTHSVFANLTQASSFFEAGSLGYSDTRQAGRYDGLELCCEKWKVERLAVDEIHSSYFQNPKRFPEGSVHFDHALLMRNVQHEWHGRTEICCPANKANRADI